MLSAIKEINGEMAELLSSPILEKNLDCLRYLTEVAISPLLITNKVFSTYLRESEVNIIKLTVRIRYTEVAKISSLSKRLRSSCRLVSMFLISFFLSFIVRMVFVKIRKYFSIVFCAGEPFCFWL